MTIRFPLIGTCDWNDGMNHVGAQGKGESVWLAFFKILVLRKMKYLCQVYGDVSFVCEMEKEENELYDVYLKFGGAKLNGGSHENSGVNNAGFKEHNKRLCDRRHHCKSIERGKYQFPGKRICFNPRPLRLW